MPLGPRARIICQVNREEGDEKDNRSREQRLEAFLLGLAGLKDQEVSLEIKTRERPVD